jgi:hypothetical protein
MNKHVFMVINSVYQYSLGVECNHQFVSFTLKNMPRLPGMTVFVTRYFSSHSFFFFKHGGCYYRDDSRALSSKYLTKGLLIAHFYVSVTYCT